MGFGCGVERFGLFLRMVSKQPLSLLQRGFSLWLGVELLLIAAGVAVISRLQFRTVVRSPGEKEIPCGYRTNRGRAGMLRRPCGKGQARQADNT
jgi:putative membrane protein